MNLCAFPIGSDAPPTHNGVMILVSLLSIALLSCAAPPAPIEGAADDEAVDNRVLVLDLGGDVDEESRRAITALVALNLQRRGLPVMSGDDVRGLLALDSEKQNLGCADESCLAELAGALNARLVVSGFAGRLGSLIVVNLSLFDARTAKAHGRATVEANSLEELPKKLEPAVDELVREFLPREPSVVAPIVLASAGGVALLGGVVTVVAAAAVWNGYGAERQALLAVSQRYEERQDAALLADLADGHDRVEDARATWNSVGIGAAWAGASLVAVGAATVAGGITWLVVGGAE